MRCKSIRIGEMIGNGGQWSCKVSSQTVNVTSYSTRQHQVMLCCRMELRLLRFKGSYMAELILNAAHLRCTAHLSFQSVKFYTSH
jgi:hypothetical protein